jgi:NADH-quinone oxidoreductase subunit E
LKTLFPDELIGRLRAQVAAAEHPRELAVDVLFALQAHSGWLPDEAVETAARLLGMTALEVDELATFYNFLYRSPVGRHVIHVCDSVVCWMQGAVSVLDHLRQRLGIAPGETTPDGLFTLLPVCCIGYCDRAPAMLVDQQVHGELTPERIDGLLAELRADVPRATSHLPSQDR